MKNNRILQVLSLRPFLFLWLAEVFSQIAFNMVNFILLLVVFKLTNSNFAVSLMILSFIVPSIFFGMLAGVYVDRWDKKNVLFFSNVLRVAVLVLLVFFHSNILIVYLLAFIGSLITQFFIPAETPMIPLIVRKDLLLSANALFSLGIYGSIFVAYALSGPFILFLSPEYIFFILGLFYFLAAVFIYLIKISKRAQIELRGKKIKWALVADIKKAFRVITKTKKIYHALFLLTLIQTIVLILATIGPGYASQVLNIKVDEFPLYIVTPITFGMFIAAVILGNFSSRQPRQVISTIGVFLGGLAILALPYGSKVASKPFIMALNEFLPKILVIDILHIMIFLAFILGVANALVFVPSNTVLQEETTDAFRGKIYGTLSALVGISSLFPIIIAGELADLFGVAKVLTGIAIILLGIGFLRVVFNFKG